MKPPSINETAFACPHCRAFTTQTWFGLHSKSLTDKRRTPIIPDAYMASRVQADENVNPEWKEKLITWAEKMESRFIFDEELKEGEYVSHKVNNLHLSRCYNCERFAVWIHDQLIHPTSIAAPEPNPDLPPDVLRDYEEAGRIVSESPRGAAALLRLAIQKLCAVRGEEGELIDDDIESLVTKGLAPMVRQALDALRVIGNEAVHPGTLNLNDDRDTAMRLFGLVNIIAEQMISSPKHIQELYDGLP